MPGLLQSGARELRASLRGQLAAFDPPLRLLAEDVLGECSTIDFVTADPSGQVVLVLVGEEGSDLALFTRALAQRAWVHLRIRDWLKLAPGLELRPDAPVRAVLLCPSFAPETVAAARTLEGKSVDLAAWRPLESGPGPVAVEPLPPTPSASRFETLALERPAPAEGAASGFRSGLSDRDLELTPEERRALE